MPLLKLQTSVPLSDEQRNALLPTLSKLLVEGMGKPEQYVMVTVETAGILMAGKAGPAALAEVRSIGGLNGRVNSQLSQKLCAVLEQTLGIPAARVYINFANITADHWGWNGSTFG